MDQAVDASLYRPKPDDLVAFLPYACRQLQAHFPLHIVVETVDDGPADDKKPKREKTPQTSATAPPSDRGSDAALELAEADEIVLVARCDPPGRVLELLFHRCSTVPRLLLKIVGLCVPFHERLRRIAFVRSPLDGAALYEVKKFLPLSRITEVVLDDAPVLHRNYHLLLEPPVQLRVLHLTRCGLVDEDCAALAARIVHPLPASRTLACLSLDGNRIGDEGARALGDALRSNRTLRYLNLAGNVITSVGAAHVFRFLQPFPVLAEDVVLKRKRTFEYLKLRKVAYEECHRRLTLAAATAAMSGVQGRTPRGRATLVTASAESNSPETLAARAATLTAELVGPKWDPFDPSELVAVDGVTCCAGNFALSYLNLAYNELDCTSARRLAAVLAYQAEAGRGPGLVRAVLDGNALPDDCEGVRVVVDLLQRLLEAAALAAADARGGAAGKRRTDRAKTK